MSVVSALIRIFTLSTDFAERYAVATNDREREKVTKWVAEGIHMSVELQQKNFSVFSAFLKREPGLMPALSGAAEKILNEGCLKDFVNLYIETHNSFSESPLHAKAIEAVKAPFVEKLQQLVANKNEFSLEELRRGFSEVPDMLALIPAKKPTPALAQNDLADGPQ